MTTKYLLAILSLLCAAPLCLVAAPAAAATYSYDNQQRLIQVNFTNGTTLAFTYDATGNRLNAAVTAAAAAPGGTGNAASAQAAETKAAPAETKGAQPEQGRPE